MAALSRTDVTFRLPLGNRVIQTFRVTTGTASNSTEWIATGFSKIDAVTGFAVKGTTGVTDAIPSVTAPVAAIDTITSTAGTNTDIVNGDEVTIGNVTYKWVTALTLATAAVAATATLDMAGDTPANTDVVVVDGQSYSLLTTISTARYNILVDGTPATQAARIAEAIDGTGAPGTAYTLDTPPHPTYSAAVAGDTVVFTARVAGTAANGGTFSTDITGSTLSNSAGGLEAISALQAAAANEVLLGADDDAAMTNLAEAINGDGTPGTNYLNGIAPNADVTAAQVNGSGSAGVLTITARVPGTAANAVAFTESVTSGNITFTGANTLGGATAGVDAISSAAPEIGFNFVLNAQGTSVAADTNLGDLGIECSQASKVVEVTVIGIP